MQVAPIAHACIWSAAPKSDTIKHWCCFSYPDWFLECISSSFCQDSTSTTLSKALWSHLPHLMIYVLSWGGSEMSQTLHFASLEDFPISRIVPEPPILCTSEESGLKQGINWRWSVWYNNMQCFLKAVWMGKEFYSAAWVIITPFPSFCPSSWVIKLLRFLLLQTSFLTIRLAWTLPSSFLLIYAKRHLFNSLDQPCPLLSLMERCQGDGDEATVCTCILNTSHITQKMICLYRGLE